MVIYRNLMEFYGDFNGDVPWVLMVIFHGM